jgi:hypothetical protein
MPSKRLKKIYKNLKYKYRLVIYNESTLDMEYSFFLSQLNVILALCSLLLIGMLLSFLIITFTPVKYYLPGFGEAGVRKQLRELMVETEKLKAKQRENDLWTENIRQVLSGEIPSDKIHIQEAMPKDSSKK